MSEILKKAIANLGIDLKDIGTILVENALKPLAKEFARLFSKFIEGIVNGELPKNSKVYEVDIINKDVLVKISRECIVPNCNEVVAMKKKGENECIIYLAYSVNGTLLPQEKNFYVIISAKEADNTIEELFGANDLIILN